MKPLAPEQYLITFTASRAMHEKLREAQALLRHQVPSGDVAEIFDQALSPVYWAGLSPVTCWLPESIVTSVRIRLGPGPSLIWNAPRQGPIVSTSAATSVAGPRRRWMPHRRTGRFRNWLIQEAA